MTTAVSVSNLTVISSNGRMLLDDISFVVEQGEFLGIAGTSGSGKTTTALALLGHTRPGATITAGNVEVEGRSILTMSMAERQRLRGQVIAYVPQDARAALTPTMRLGHLLDEAMSLVPANTQPYSEQQVLDHVGLGNLGDLRRRFPHQLSGGQLQRFSLALALVGGARIIVLDEPTSALDPLSRDALLDQIEQLRQQFGLTIIMITHDLVGMLPRLERTLLFDHGRIAQSDSEHTPTIQRAASSKELAITPPGLPISIDRVLTVHQLSATYIQGGRRRVEVLHDVELELASGESVALIGPSGCGKTTLARCIAGLHRTWDGDVHLEGMALAPDARQRPYAQRRRLQMVFQNPYGSLNPRTRIGDLIARPLILAGEHAHSNERVAELLEHVQLPSGYQHRYPYQLSGGERQRVAIACALASEPSLLICDEVTSALDAITQQVIVELLREIQQQTALTMLVITHDHRLAHTLGHRIISMEAGRLVR